MAPLTCRSSGALDPQITTVGSVVLFVIGVTILTAAIIARLKQR
jgi:membrane-bound lytic murein transglycosylase